LQFSGGWDVLRLFGEVIWLCLLGGSLAAKSCALCFLYEHDVWIVLSENVFVQVPGKTAAISGLSGMSMRRKAWGGYYEYSLMTLVSHYR